MSAEPYAITFRKKAIAQIVGAVAHGYEHFGDERGRQEIDHALELIAAHPYIGHAAPNAFEGVRRLHLRELRRISIIASTTRDAPSRFFRCGTRAAAQDRTSKIYVRRNPKPTGGANLRRRSRKPRLPYER